MMEIDKSVCLTIVLGRLQGTRQIQQLRSMWQSGENSILSAFQNNALSTIACFTVTVVRLYMGTLSHKAVPRPTAVTWQDLTLSPLQSQRSRWKVKLPMVVFYLGLLHNTLCIISPWSIISPPPSSAPSSALRYGNSYTSQLHIISPLPLFRADVWGIAHGLIIHSIRY